MSHKPFLDSGMYQYLRSESGKSTRQERRWHSLLTRTIQIIDGSTNLNPDGVLRMLTILREYAYKHPWLLSPFHRLLVSTDILTASVSVATMKRISDK